MWVAFALQKLLTFFQQKFQHICVSLDVNFNETLTNNVVSFEQLGQTPFLFVLFFWEVLFVLSVYVEPTLAISKSKRLAEILRDIRILTYQFCRIKKKINRTATFHKGICNLNPGERYIENIVEKGRRCFLGAISPLFNNLLLSAVRYRY